MTVEDIVNLPVFVTVLSEEVPQEHQLCMQVVSTTENSSPMHQCSKHSFVCWMVVMGPSTKIEICTGGFTVHSVAQRSIGSSVNIYVQEKEVALLFSLHGELNGLMDAIRVIHKVIQPVRTVWPDDECVIHVAKPAKGFLGG
jgi:hypothetical protein